MVDVLDLKENDEVVIEAKEKQIELLCCIIKA